MPIFKRSEDAPQQEPNSLADVATETIRQAEDGSEILYGLARQLDDAGACADYVRQVRQAAHAIRQLTALHPEAGHVEEDSVFGAREHASEIRRALRPGH